MSLHSSAEPTNLPAIRSRGAVAVRAAGVQLAPPRRGRVAVVVLTATMFAAPFAGILLSLPNP